MQPSQTSAAIAMVPEASDSLGTEVVWPMLLPLAIHVHECSSPGGGRGELRTAKPPVADDGIDRISSLPDNILGEIVSLLPTKDGARTQVLSTRWSPIWLNAPLNLDLFDTCNDFEALTSTITRIVSTHKGPAKLFRLPWYYYHHHHDTVDIWLQSPALNILHEIKFYDSCNRALPNAPQPPPVTLACFSSSLRVMTLHCCSIPYGIVVGVLLFPQLKMLGLSFVSISEGSLHSFIACCPTLECLLLDHSYSFRCVRINSASLIGIAVYSNFYSSGLEEIVIENAPSLERFFYDQWDKGLRVSVVSAPKLGTLGCSLQNDGPSRIVFGSTVIKGMDVISSKTVISSIRILSVNMHVLSLDTIIDLLRCFPCLEKLYVQAGYCGRTNSRHHDHHHLIKSLDFHLRKVVIYEYQGLKTQVNLAKFFIENAKVLETMRFLGAPGENIDKVFVAKQGRKLQLEKRASSVATFHFGNGKCYHEISHIMDVHALSRADPFECCYCR